MAHYNQSSIEYSIRNAQSHGEAQQVAELFDLYVELNHDIKETIDMAVVQFMQSCTGMGIISAFELAMVITIRIAGGKRIDRQNVRPDRR